MTLEIFLRLLVAGLMIGSVYALIGMAYSLVYRGTRLINWAQGDFFMVGAFVGYTFVGPLGMPYWAALLAAGGAMFLFGAATHGTIVRVITRRGGRLVDVLLATIGLSIVLQNAVSLLWGTDVKQIPSPLPGTFAAGPVLVPNQSLAVLGVSVATVVAIYLFLYRTPFGMTMRASAENRYAASVVGIRTGRVDAVTWGLAAAVCGIAGVMLAPLFGAHFYMGVTVGLKGFAAAVVGGFGNPWGALVGGLMLGVLETFGAFVLSSPWRDAVTMLVLIVFLIVRPTGLFRSEAFHD